MLRCVFLCILGVYRSFLRRDANAASQTIYFRFLFSHFILSWTHCTLEWARGREIGRIDVNRSVNNATSSYWNHGMRIIWVRKARMNTKASPWLQNIMCYFSCVFRSYIKTKNRRKSTTVRISRPRGSNHTRIVWIVRVMTSRVGLPFRTRLCILLHRYKKQIGILFL